MRFFVSLLLFIMTVNTGYARQDAVHGQWQKTHSLPLIWDNVESAPEWIAGVKPAYQFAHHNDTVQLAPGDWVVVAVSAGQWLRIINTQAESSLNSLLVMRSVDGASFVEEALHYTDDGQQGLTVTRHPALSWVRVENKENAVQELELALFISRLPEKAAYPDYHIALSPRGAAEQVKISEHANNKTYWALGEGKPLEFEVEGPLRLRLNSRLHMQEYFRSMYEPYVIKALLDNRAFAHLEMETSVANENSQLIKVNSCVSPLSNLQSNYLDIPEGKHYLRLKSHSQQYVELLASRDENDYLFKHNVKQHNLLQDAQNDSLWDYDVAMLPLLLDSTTAFYQQEAASQRMIRDNRFSPGSLRARTIMSGNTSYRFENAERLRMLSSQHVSLRKRIDLLPMRASPEENEALQQRVMTISPLRLSSKDSDVVLWHQQLATLAEQQEKAKFVRINSIGGQLEYRLPQSDAARSLRIYLASNSNGDSDWATIQLGDAVAQRIRRITLNAKLNAQLNVTPEYLAEAIVYEGKQLSAFAPNWVEINVPAGIEKITIKAQRDDLWLALRLQQAGMYKPSERDYLTTLHSTVTPEVARLTFLNLLEKVGKDHDDTQWSPSFNDFDPELVNQWWPLIRYLKSHRNDFQRINESTNKAHKKPNKKAILDRSLVSQYVKQAMMAEDENEFISAIAHWSSAMQHSSGYKYDSFRLRRATALLKNGNAYYAEKEWWTIYSGSRFPDIRDNALQSTIDQVSKQKNPDRLVKVLSASLVEHPSTMLLARLVTAMVAAGETQKALYLGLLLNPSQQPVESLLQAAASEGWWQVFEQLKGALTDVDAQQYWLGVKNVVQGDFNAAQENWLTGGQRGLQAKARLEKALEIRQGLASPQLAEREQALRIWQTWQDKEIENGKWRSANNYVTSYKASERLVSTASGIQSLQYKVTSHKPLQLQIHGAHRLRFFVRPLHAAESHDSLDGWMVLRANQGTLHVPFFNNRLDEEKQLLGPSEVRAGKSVSQEIQLETGFNTVELNLLKINAIVTVQILRPVIEWPVFPDLSDPQIHARYVMDEKYQGSTITTNIAVNVNTDVIIAEACKTSQQQVTFTEPLFLLDDVIASIDKAGVSDSSPPALVDAKLKHLFSLLWKMEQNPKVAMRFAFEAVKLLEANPERYDLQKYASHLERHLRWQILNTFERRAGVKKIELLDNTPENPDAKVSHELLPALENHQRRLKGYSKLLLALEQTRASKLKFIFNSEGDQLATNEKLRLIAKLDVDESKQLNLTHAENQMSLILNVPDGAHSVSLRQLNPYIGHSVRVSVYEETQQGKWVPYMFDYPSRNYHVATKDEPLIMHARGPGRVRIDEWRDGRTLYKYQDVDNGWQTLRLYPDKKQKTAMYRVFERVYNEADEVTALLKSTREISPLSSLLPPPKFDNKAVQEPLDQLRLGGQEDGTWSLTVAPTSRRNLDEDDGGATDAEVFTEVRVSHRKYVEQADFYHHADLFLRARDDGGATTGAREWLSKLNVWRNIDLDVQGALFVQQPNNNIGAQWSADLRAKLSRDYALTQNIKHKASLTLFNRWMSLDALPLLNSMDVDQDVFTRYKNQHRHGLKFCDDVSYRPWVDSNLVANACLNSNEDMNIFDPDNFGMNLGGRFLLGSLLLRADYGMTRYFSDLDRTSAITRQKLRLEADWFQWRDSRNGLQIGLRVDHDFSHNDNSVWLSLTWHRANGRLFQDFRPSEIAFRNLRQRLHYDYLYANPEREAYIQ